MAITKRFEEKIEITPPHSVITVRTATIVEEDGVEIARSYHRAAVNPGEDASDMSAEVQAVVAAVHTSAVVSAFETEVAAAEVAAAEA